MSLESKKLAGKNSKIVGLIWEIFKKKKINFWIWKFVRKELQNIRLSDIFRKNLKISSTNLIRLISKFESF